MQQQVDAVLPPGALAPGEKGRVVLFVTVEANGEVGAVAVAESGGAALDDAAIAAVRQWRFSPARRGDSPVASRIRVPFPFEEPLSAGVSAAAGAPAAATSGASASAARAGAPSSSAATPRVSSEPNVAAAATTAPAGEGAVVRSTANVESSKSAVEAAAAAAAKPDASSTPATPGAANASGGEITVLGRSQPPNRGAADYQLRVGGLAAVPRHNAADVLELAPGILLTNEGGDAHAEQVFLRGFDAREGQDIEFTVDGAPINESGNLHGNGYADTHFIIPELIDSLRVLEGPFDPRQGNYAVAGSADYHLALARRGLSAKFSVGSYGTYRQLLTYGPPDGSPGTFAAGELYQTDGFGQNRDGKRGTAMLQYEKVSGSSRYRVAANAYLASFHTAGVLREDDYRAGRVGFFDTYDPLQGEDSSRYSLVGAMETRRGALRAQNMVFLSLSSLRLREDFTGFLLDVQEPLQAPHGQRGDLLDLNDLSRTFGLRGSARVHTLVDHKPQELELGYFARGDLVSSSEQRIEAATGHPYHTDTNLESTLGDLGLYADLNLRLLRLLALRAGVRADLFTYSVNDLCAVQSVEHPSRSNPPGDQSCLSQQNFGAYREANQRAGAVGSTYLPRASLLAGPFHGLSASLSIGKGVRSVDPSYVTQDAKTPFAGVSAYEAGLSFEKALPSGLELGARSALFETVVERDLIFSQTAGRNVLGGKSTRVGSASSLRVTGAFYDLSSNVTYVRARFDDTHLLIPYVPDLVVRGDGALFGDLPWLRSSLGGKALHATLGAGVSYVGRRPLPYGTRSDRIFTLDASTSLGLGYLELSVSAQNLLDRRYRLGEYNYASDFHSQTFPTLVPVRHFTAGAPRTVLFSVTLNYGDLQ